jgi:hypothetical protein
VLKKILNDVVLGDNPPLKVRENRIYGPYFLKRFEQCFKIRTRLSSLILPSTWRVSVPSIEGRIVACIVLLNQLFYAISISFIPRL